MSSEDWYRNTEWNVAIEAAFEAKLRRARRKEQYLRIQACVLASVRPDIALALLDRYFQLPDKFDNAQAHVDRANAYLAQGKLPEAMLSLEDALNREAEYPHSLTQAYLDLPYLIAVNGVAEQYARAKELLVAQRKRLMFPVDTFKWNVASALIAKARNEYDSSRLFARAALEAAGADRSDFRYHPSVGLVGESYGEVRGQMRKLCAA